MANQVIHRGVTLWDLATNGASCECDFGIGGGETKIDAAPQGDGEFAKPLGSRGKDHVIKLVYRIADANVAALRGMLKAARGLPRGTMETPEGSMARCIIVDVTQTRKDRVQLQNGSLGWLLGYDLTVRESE